MLLVTGVVTAAATAALINAVLPLRGRLATWLGLYCLLLAQIVLLSEVLSELRVLGRTGFLAGHAVLLALALLTWDRRGRPPLHINDLPAAAELRRGLRRHPLVMALAGGALLIVMLVLVLNRQYPFLAFDTRSYHVPRALHWLETGTARHFPTDNFRQVEFPPNASFYMAWLVALSGNTGWLTVPGVLASVALAAGTTGLARAAGYGRAAALLAGLVWFGVPEVIQQMRNGMIDVTAAAAGVCWVLFTVRALHAAADGVSLRRNHDLFYAGIAAGLFAGTKLTAAFLVPPLALALGGYAWWRLRERALCPLVALSVAAATGFLLLGSYNYVLNLFDIGHPFSSRDKSQSADALIRHEVSPAAETEFFSFGGNLARYIYHTMDWWLQGGIVDEVRARHDSVYRRLDRALSLNMEGTEQFQFGSQRSRSYGPVMYAVLLASPAVLVGLLVRAPRSPRRTLSAVYIVTGWGWLLLFAALAAWSETRTHLFVVFLPYLVAATVPALYTRRAVGWLWLGPLVAITVITGLLMTFSFVGWARPDVERNLAVLRAYLAPGARVGLAGDQLDIMLYVDGLPGQDFTLIAAADAPAQLAAGDLDAVLAQGGYCTLGGLEPVPLYHLDDFVDARCLVVKDPAALVAARWEGVPGDSAPATLAVPGAVGMSLDDFAPTKPGQQVPLLIVPFPVAWSRGTDPLGFSAAYESDLDLAGRVRANCAGEQVTVRVAGGQLTWVIDALPGEEAGSVVACELRLRPGQDDDLLDDSGDPVTIIFRQVTAAPAGVTRLE